MSYFYEKNGQVYLTDSLGELIHHSFPSDVQSVAKNAHYVAVAPVIFSDEYLGCCVTTSQDITLRQNFINFLAHHKLVSSNEDYDVDLLYLLALSHDTALRAGVWSLGSQPHLNATKIIADLLKTDAIGRIVLMKEAITAWKELFLEAQLTLQQQEPETSFDSTQNMLLQLRLPAHTADDSYTSDTQYQNDQISLEIEQTHALHQEVAYYASYSDEEDEYYNPRYNYKYN
ncbi:MAG: hypothetical protein BGO90_00930 [Legionella sp. 40-6]|nr:hypothetical protein [Legionella sp.]OJY45708.1 MAG: hypothetical protein BGO90_00930 [Legionella sp. 40-6]